ncbi:hypothetical protein ACFQ9X_23465 [Catenulispora yoronensis]
MVGAVGTVGVVGVVGVVGTVGVVGAVAEQLVGTATQRNALRLGISGVEDGQQTRSGHVPHAPT